MFVQVRPNPGLGPERYGVGERLSGTSDVRDIFHLLVTGLGRTVDIIETTPKILCNEKKKRILKIELKYLLNQQFFFICDVLYSTFCRGNKFSS